MTCAVGRRGLLFVVALLAASAAAFGEFRTWTAASGGFTTEAEFIELKGNTVRLRLKDGTQLDLAIEKLSAADQKYAREQGSKAAPVNPFAAGSKAPASPSSKNESLAKLEASVARSQTAEEALRLYRIFYDDPSTSEADRKAIEPKVAEYRELADKKMMRMQGKWVTEEEFRKVRNQANSLMKQGLELFRLKQEDGFRKKFAEAAALEPDSVRADFAIGLIYSIISVDYTKTKQYFESCLKRDPSNVCVLNNLALASVKRGDFGSAVANWRKAAEIEPSQHLVQNLGRFIDQAGQQKIKPAKNQLENITNVYTTLVGSGKFERANLKRGWMWMVLDEDLLSLDDKKEQAEEKVSVVPAPGEDGSVVVGGGTGFMIFPDYILTNNHVVDGGTSFEIQTHDGSKDKTLKATLVAASKKPDLALLRCEGLSAQHLAIDPAPLGRGTDIMTLGYPEMFILGASLKATRGVISAVPSSSVDDMYLYDAVVNHGNSGGPVFDSRGNVVAVTTIMVRTEGKYGGGIPGAVALEFVKKHVPNYAPPELKTAVLDWPAVDKVASPATVLVWTRSKTPGSSQIAGADYYEDRDCMVCNGGKVMECPIKGCNMGLVVVRGKKLACPACNGKGKIICLACKATGFDPDLVPPKVASTTPPTTPGSPSSGTRIDPAAGLPSISTSETRRLLKDIATNKWNIAEPAAKELAAKRPNSMRDEVAQLLESLVVLDTTNGHVDTACAEALAIWGRANSVGPLIIAMDHEWSNTRTAATRALGTLGFETAVPALVDRLRNPTRIESKVKRFSAAEEKRNASAALIKIGPKARPALEAMLLDADADVRNEAQKVLNAIGPG
jgi:S1-C subfamily serine protease